MPTQSGIFISVGPEAQVFHITHNARTRCQLLETLGEGDDLPYLNPNAFDTILNYFDDRDAFDADELDTTTQHDSSLQCLLVQTRFLAGQLRLVSMQNRIIDQLHPVVVSCIQDHCIGLAIGIHQDTIKSHVDVFKVTTPDGMLEEQRQYHDNLGYPSIIVHSACLTTWRSTDEQPIPQHHNEPDHIDEPCHELHADCIQATNLVQSADYAVAPLDEEAGDQVESGANCAPKTKRLYMTPIPPFAPLGLSQIYDRQHPGESSQPPAPPEAHMVDSPCSEGQRHSVFSSPKFFTTARSSVDSLCAPPPPKKPMPRKPVGRGQRSTPKGARFLQSSVLNRLGVGRSRNSLAPEPANVTEHVSGFLNPTGNIPGPAMTANSLQPQLMPEQQHYTIEPDIVHTWIHIDEPPLPSKYERLIVDSKLYTAKLRLKGWRWDMKHKLDLRY
ncbi:hypothetical protein K458DRAFT_399817 [Lentithecium fluviatile CBS 122367]|uniref:BTB domain-containing protein n=1 Tax=Lentithecium fluviatile CBS 122367 TaxID=1168545 RepID=A0A6G1JK48_9PLEO|nr:hypothetical protein K458DRAFT_399817 [Lentithecium fluviatile CBS 122367]